MAAQIKKYDPNQYNFGDFAKTMNQNFAIERAQNGQGGAFGVNAGVNPANPVNLGGTTNSQTLGNLGQNSANGVGAVGVNAGGVGNLSGVNTLGQAKPLAGRDVFRGITNSFFDTLKANGVGTSMTYSSPLVPKTPEFSPTVQAGEGDVPESVIQVGEAIKNGYGYVNRNEYNRFELTDSNVDAVSEYLRERGFAESDIQEYLKNKNKLVYDYSYRENAGNNIGGAAVGGEPQLSQGGQVAQSSGTLSFEDWQNTYSIDPAVEYQNAQAQLDYEFKTWMSEYGARAEQLYQMGLSNSGVSDIYGANAYTAYVQASMDLKRAEIAQQAENKRAYQEYLDGIEAQQSAVTSAAFNSYAGSYTPAQEQSIRVALAAQGLSAEQIKSAIAQLNNYYNSLPEDQRPDVVASNAKVNEAFQSLAASYATDTAADKDQRIRNMYAAMGWSQSEIDKLIGMLNGFAGVSGNQVDSATIINDAAVRIATTIFTDAETGTSTYTGSESQKNYIRQLMQLAEYKALAPYVEEIIAKMDENLKVNKGAIVGDIVSGYKDVSTNKNWLTNPSTSTMANYTAILDQQKTALGANSQEYKDTLAAASSTIKDYILAATDDEKMLEQAGAWLGVEDWTLGETDEELIASERINAVLDAAGDLHKQGYMTYSDYKSIIDTWLTEQLSAIDDRKSPLLDLAQKYDKLTEYYREYDIEPIDYSYMTKQIADNVKINSAKIQNALGTKVTKLYLSGSVADKAFSVECTYSKPKKADREYVSHLAEINGPGSLFTYGDNIYYSDESGNPYVITSYAFFGAAASNNGNSIRKIESELLWAVVNKQSK